ncbi:MAG: isoprenylcysteine carboxylmethyltransferase family protein, partial [bacterium]|nr:isoprenylcysteine carboxylmethyltransferase family protein [bacterium]
TPCAIELSYPPRIIGCFGLVPGMALRIWAQATIGVQWTAGIKPGNGHTPVCRGPYYWIRHPIYASYVMMAPGLFLATEDWLLGGLAAAYTLLSVARIPAEERQLVSRFAETYARYQRTTDGLIPIPLIAAALCLINAFGMISELSWLLC